LPGIFSAVSFAWWLLSLRGKLALQQHLCRDLRFEGFTKGVECVFLEAPKPTLFLLVRCCGQHHGALLAEARLTSSWQATALVDQTIRSDTLVHNGCKWGRGGRGRGRGGGLYSESYTREARFLARWDQPENEEEEFIEKSRRRRRKSSFRIVHAREDEEEEEEHTAAAAAQDKARF